MPVPLETVIRAACGDAQALADIVGASEHDVDSVDLLTAVVLTDPAPHPLAALAALAMQDRSPQTLCAVARRALPSVAALLEQDACAALRAALAPHLSRVWDALADPSDRESIAACARLAPAMNAAAVAALLERIGAEGWTQAPPEAQETLLQAIESALHAAARGGGSVWAALESDARRRIAHRAAQSAFAAAALLDRIEPEGWKQTPPDARAALLQAIESVTWYAARGGGAVWRALEPDERDRVTRIAARDANSAADLLERIGPEGWKQTPPAARAALLHAICDDRGSAAKGGGAVWRALEPEAIVRIARIVARDANSAADLLERIGAEGWRPAPPAARATLLRSIVRSPKAAARGGGAVWRALEPDERALVAQATCDANSAASVLLARIGAEGWAQTPPDAQETLLQAIAINPWEATRGGGAVWAALDGKVRTRVAQIAAQHASAASVLLARIGAEGWAQTPPETRATLLQALGAAPLAAAYGGGKVWRAFTPDERARVARSAAGDARSAAALLDAIGAEGWALAPPEAQETLLDAAARESRAAARALLILGDALDDGARMRLLRVAAPEDAWSVAVAQALADGCAWRDWMAAFVPDRNASGDAIARWRVVAHRLPAVVAARLSVGRPQRR